MYYLTFVLMTMMRNVLMISCTDPFMFLTVFEIAKTTDTGRLNCHCQWSCNILIDSLEISHYWSFLLMYRQLH